LKFLVEKGFYYERTGTLEMKIIKDIQFVGAMLPPSGDVKPIDPRFLSLYCIFALIPPNQENLERIYKSILEAHVK
jgi:dynein heavy chain